MHNELGFIGLGRMGLNMTTRLIEQGYRVVGYDVETVACAAAQAVGVEMVVDYTALVAALGDAPVVWLMVPSQFVDAVLAEISPLLPAGATVIDGGNSFYTDSLRRYQTLKAKSINFIDVGTSGGMEGARRGASLMIGGEAEVFATIEPLFAALAAPEGYARVGGPGAGHFVKMVHNGIEYGMMGAIAEGVNVLHQHQAEFDIDINEVFKPYEHESIITSKLVTWLRTAYDEGQIDAIAGEVPTGETEAEMEHIIRELGDVPVLAAAVAQRQQTREVPSYVGTLIAAMRNQFGGHSTVTKE